VIGAFDDAVQEWLTARYEHELFMATAHHWWELLYGIPCGPYDESRARRPMGILPIEAPDD
jgi:hypothetical protein